MSEDNRQEREGQGTRPASRRATGLGIAVVVIAVAMIGAVAFLALRGDPGSSAGSGVVGGSGDPTGAWDVALTCVDEEVSWGRLDLSQFSEDRLSGSGDLTSPDGDITSFNVDGEVGEPQEGGLPVRLSLSDGCQLQGTLDGDAMEGTTVFSGTDFAGTFAAVRAGDVTEDSHKEAVRRYLQAWDVDGDTTGDELKERIGENVIAPFYWDSPAGANAGELVDRLGGEEKVRTSLELVEYVAAGSTGVMRYRQDYQFGRDEGGFHGATPARVIRWGDDYRVLGAGAATADPWRTLMGTWEFKPEGELRGGASDLRLGPGGTFLATIDDISYGGGYYNFAGRSEDILVGGSDAGGQVPTEGGGAEDIDITFYQESGAEALSLYDVEVTEEGTLVGMVTDRSAQGMETFSVAFVAERVEVAGGGEESGG